MNTDNVLMHNTDVETEGVGRGLIRRKTERWVLQTRLFLDSKWGKEQQQQRGLLSANEGRDDKSGRRGEGRGGGGGGVGGGSGKRSSLS